MDAACICVEKFGLPFFLEKGFLHKNTYVALIRIMIYVNLRCYICLTL